MTMTNRISRPVTVTSLCLAPRPEIPPSELFEKTVFPSEILAAAETAAGQGTDLILTPEIWSGETAVPMGNSLNGYFSPVLDRCRSIARTGHCYMAVTMPRYLTPREEAAVRKQDRTGLYSHCRRFRANSTLLIDRTGTIVYIYDKMYPYPPEFNTADGVSMTVSEMMQTGIQEEPILPGKTVGVYDADFGRLGLSICFDANFPRLWEELARAGAELVVWSAAFSGGRNHALHAGTYHYYVVTSTCIGKGDCRVVDITGDELLVRMPEEGLPVQSTTVTLDLDRTLFHKNFNEGKIAEACARYPGMIHVDRSCYGEEEWLILSSASPELRIKDLCKEFGLMSLQEFKTAGVADFIDCNRIA